MFRSHSPHHGVCPVRLPQELPTQVPGPAGPAGGAPPGPSHHYPHNIIFIIVTIIIIIIIVINRSPPGTSSASAGRWPGAWSTSATRRSVRLSTKFRGRFHNIQRGGLLKILWTFSRKLVDTSVFTEHTHILHLASSASPFRAIYN